MGHSSSKQFNETNVKESNENVGRNSNTGRSEEKSEEHSSSVVSAYAQRIAHLRSRLRICAAKKINKNIKT